MSSSPALDIIHANCVDVAGTGVLIIGASGTGKSSLTLKLLALGAQLVSDDRTQLTTSGQALIASAPSTIVGLIEARGVGILAMPTIAHTEIKFIIDLDCLTHERLPYTKTQNLLGLNIAVIEKSETPAFAEAVFLAAKFGLSPHV